ncbi:MAG: RES family NAD+ phosphorylase [Fluviicola sp.]|nr:RES family NAD+ phosphorylase [Fluviicola sp.]
MTTKQNFILCSNCFHDEGLSLAAFKIGTESDSICPSCLSTNGKKLNEALTESLSHGFFVRGSLHKSDYGAIPIIQANKLTKTEVEFNELLLHDTKLLEKSIGVGFFYYGPRMWMVGEIEPLKDLQTNENRLQTIEKIIEAYTSKLMTINDKFYRLRKNPSKPNELSQYDSPPRSGNGRLDSEKESVLYGSQDLEICIHECRSTVEDNLFIATLKPTRELKLLDLSVLIEEENTEFESLDLTVQMLFFAGNHSYEISREIAIQIKQKGFDGLIYPSYYSTIRTGAMPFDTEMGISIRKLPLYSDYANTQVIPNIALFGTPIKDGKVVVKCINKVILNQVKYDIQFGPAEY